MYDEIEMWFGWKPKALLRISHILAAMDLLPADFEHEVPGVFKKLVDDYDEAKEREMLAMLKEKYNE